MQQLLHSFTHPPVYWLSVSLVAPTSVLRNIISSSHYQPPSMSRNSVVEVKRPKKRVTFGLIVLAILMPWLALYLDGSSWPTIGCNFAAWLFLFPIGSAGAAVHAIICLCRSDDHRKYSKPARRKLCYNSQYSADNQPKDENEVAEPGPEPKPAPATRAVEDKPKPIEKAPTEPPAGNVSATTSSTSVSSSDVEKETDPAPAPPQRTATAPLPRTATVPPPRSAIVRNEDDHFKDPYA